MVGEIDVVAVDVDAYAGEYAFGMLTACASDIRIYLVLIYNAAGDIYVDICHPKHSLHSVFYRLDFNTKHNILSRPR